MRGKRAKRLRRQYRQVAKELALDEVRESIRAENRRRRKGRNTMTYIARLVREVLLGRGENRAGVR